MTKQNSNIETEYLELTAKKAWPVVYQQIRHETSKYEFKSLESQKPQNKTLNRYRDVSPFDHSRIVLKKGPCNYINANIIKVDKANRQYILTQGPLAQTVGHFWLMVWEQRSTVVLMLNKIIENKQVKCYQYWPQDVGPEHILDLDDVGLTLEYMTMMDHSFYCVRVLKLKEVETGDTREILQFHYTTWPDFGVPSSPTQFLEFLRVVRASGALEPNVGPPVVHCSAGIGRSGTFCLVDSCLVLIEKFGLNSVDVKEVLMEMRRYRMGLIQTAEQLRFSYQAIIEGAKQLSDPPSDDVSNYSAEKSNSDVQSSSDEEEPPPLPPRGESLIRSNVSDGLPDRPLPAIPTSASLNDIAYNSHDYNSDKAPSRPLPVAPEGSSDEEEIALLSDGTPNGADSITSESAVVRKRKRAERQQAIAAQVREIKRKQQSAEYWSQLKRSLFKPVFIVGAGLLLVGGGAFAYYYLKA